MGKRVPEPGARRCAALPGTHRPCAREDRPLESPQEPLTRFVPRVRYRMRGLLLRVFRAQSADADQLGQGKRLGLRQVAGAGERIASWWNQMAARLACEPRLDMRREPAHERDPLRAGG